ncbi:MAG: hypothetical protein ACRCVX_08145 [Shewanella sp.]
MRLVTTMLIFALALAAPAFASEPMAPVDSGASATKARDINGFALGEPIEDAIKRVEVTFVQGELVQSTLNGIQYDFGVCPSGRIYRIESSQMLGNFIPDEVFMRKLNAQLFQKYGYTELNTPDNLSWDLIERVRYSDGAVRPFKTNWFSVLVSGGHGSAITLDMKMLDFRICWEDKVQMNQQPRSEANDKIVF